MKNGQNMHPGSVVQIKLASIVVHAQELLSVDGREADKTALLGLLYDPDVLRWLDKFDDVLLPVKRRK